ncbi:hypothetical protein [Fodinibius halophilus]|uniref:Uncharacterized protein n=1 Tax=Fodinibius halophilus TaxID=1736908 RepID=A0A6M1T0K6_9BACT|nr:hypothetical protein [Fodinibius halophilus]NGP89628.1 hypothetical protein [Fodinibius halophilus]
MDSDFSYIITGVLVLYVIYELLSLKKTELSEKTKLLGYFSSILMGIYITSLLYIGPDIQYLILISIFCVPIWTYYTYIRFKEDKKNVFTSLGIVGSMVAIIWLYGF